MTLRHLLVFVPFLLVACSDDTRQVNDHAGLGEYQAAPPGSTEGHNPNRNVYFGDTHVHTRYSFDAYVLGTEASPEMAYRYAKGETIEDTMGYKATIHKPLDFFAVTDHGMFLGMAEQWADPASAVGQHELARDFHNINTEHANVESSARRIYLFREAMGKFLGAPAGVLDLAMGYLSDNPMRMSAAFNYDDHLAAWQDTIRAAETHYVPGEFTTFIGYEWTVSSPAPESAAYHRNVLFESSSAPTRPFTRVDSVNPEDLWDWMDEVRSKGVDSLAIPHNSNQSNGQTFRQTYWDGRAVDKAYSQQRNRNETLIELVQLKGSSDTHPRLSPQDEWADFEILNTRKGSVWRSSNPHGSYFRQALQNGLVLKKENRGNPFRFGVIGSSDTHNATPSFNESAHFGSTPISTTPVNRASVPVDDARRAQLESLPANLRARVQLSEEAAGAYLPMRTTQFGTSGLAAVWAEENTREAIFAAMKRKETYATSGTRIRLRFFAGDLDEVDLDSPALIEQLYSKGVPMGGDLLKADEAPGFFVWAQKGEDGAPLQRVQIIKGWYNDGFQKQTEERIFDVACADGLEVDPQTHRCPDNGAQVNLADCSITGGLGAADLRTVWRDPDFDPDIDAVYYVRVLENPTCRWSTWDAVRAGIPPRNGVAPVIQERAWSSPIWYQGDTK